MLEEELPEEENVEKEEEVRGEPRGQSRPRPPRENGAEDSRDSAETAAERSGGGEDVEVEEIRGWKREDTRQDNVALGLDGVDALPVHLGLP